MTADSRVDRARALLDESKTTAPTGRPEQAAQWWGRLEVALEDLLAAVDEAADR